MEEPDPTMAFSVMRRLGHKGHLRLTLSYPRVPIPSSGLSTASSEAAPFDIYQLQGTRVDHKVPTWSVSRTGGGGGEFAKINKGTSKVSL